MGRRQDSDPRTDADVGSNCQTPGAMQKPVRTDPRAIPDVQSALMIAIENAVVADVNIPSELNVLRMKHERARLNDHVFAYTGKCRQIYQSVSMTARRRAHRHDVR